MEHMEDGWIFARDMIYILFLFLGGTPFLQKAMVEWPFCAYLYMYDIMEEASALKMLWFLEATTTNIYKINY